MVGVGSIDGMVFIIIISFIYFVVVGFVKWDVVFYFCEVWKIMREVGSMIRDKWEVGISVIRDKWEVWSVWKV